MGEPINHPNRIVKNDSHTQRRVSHGCQVASMWGFDFCDEFSNTTFTNNGDIS